MISLLSTVSWPVRAILVVLYVYCIAVLSLLPSQDLPEVPLFDGADKLVHFLMYFIFSVLLCWALKTEMQYKRLSIVIAATIGWGILMEYLQLSMHWGRSFSWYDILTNSLGVFIGILVYMQVSRKRQSQNGKSPAQNKVDG